MTPKTGSKWLRADHDPASYPCANAYTVLFVTNIANKSIKHPPQVVYEGDNGHKWSLPLKQWPGKLKPAQ